MFNVSMRGHDHLKAITPKLLSKLRAYLMRRLWIRFIGLEGLVGMIGSPAIEFIISLLGDDHLLPGDGWFAINAADQILLLSFAGIDGVIHDILERLDILIAEGA